MAEDIAKLQVEIKKVRARCKELEDAEENLNMCQIRCESAWDQLNILKSANNDLTTKNDNQEKEIFNLKEKLEEETQTKSKLQIEFEETDTKLMKANIQLETLQDEIENLKVQSSNEKFEQIQIITKLNEEILNANSKIEQLSKDNEEFNDCLKTADAEVRNEKENNEYLKNIIEKYNNENENLKTEIAQLKLKFEENSQKLTKILDAKQAEIENLKEEISETALKNDDTIKAMCDNKDLRKRNKEITARLVNVFKENEELLTTNARYENEIEELKSNLEKANENIQTLQINNSQWKENNNKLESDMNDLQNNLEQITNEKNNLADNKIKLEEKLENLNTKYIKIKQNLQVINDHLIETIQEKKELQTINELKNESPEDIERHMKNILIQITGASTQLLEKIQKSKQQIDDHYLRNDLDAHNKK